VRLTADFSQKLFIEGDFQPVPYKYYAYDSFINWLTERVVNGLKLKKELARRDIERELIEIAKIKSAVNAM
jgi:hypothetical protein